MKTYKMWQYPRGVNLGGVLNVDYCPTISTSSWQNNCFLIEIKYENIKSRKRLEESDERSSV